MLYIKIAYESTKLERWRSEDRGDEERKEHESVKEAGGGRRQRKRRGGLGTPTQEQEEWSVQGQILKMCRMEARSREGRKKKTTKV